MDQELIEAIVACNLPLVRMLLTAGANPNAQRDGKSAYQLVPSDCTDIKCLLIEAGADDPLMIHDLGWAIAVERPEIAKLLMEQGADLNVSTGAGTPLRLAASKGMADMVDVLLAAGADPDGSTHPSTALQAALESRHADIALKLLAAGADPNLTIPWGRIPAIALAAAHGFTEVVQALLDAGADVNVTVREMTINRAELQEKVRAGLKSIQAVMELIGQAMQHQEESEDDAADSEDFDEDDFEDEDLEEFEDELEDETDLTESVDTAIERMKLHSAEVQAIEPEVAIDATPVILAARCGHAEVLRLLLAAGADPNCPDGTGLSAYDWGIKHEHPQVLAVLRQAGVDSTQADPDQHLIKAAEQDDVAAIEEWLLRGAQVNARDCRRNTRNFTPLMLAAANGNLSAVTALIAAGADVNLTDRLNSEHPIPFCLLDQPYEVLVAVSLPVNVTPLILAARKGYTPVVKALIEHNADFSMNDPMNQNAIAVATLGGHIEVVKVLIAAGMPFDEPDIDGDTPLMIALLKENRSLSLFFLELEVNVNWRNEQNETPLMKAADFGNVEVLKRLLDKGADLHVLSDEQENALAIAISSKREEAAEFLRQQGATLPPEPVQQTSVIEDKAENKAEQNWGANLAQPDFSEAAQQPTYIKAVQELAARCGSTPISWHGIPGWFEIHVHSKCRAKINTDEIQQEFLERGCFVYEPMVYTSDEPEKLRILPTIDKYEAIALNQTYDCVNKIDPAYMMAWLRELEKEQPFTITWINQNIVGGKFLTSVADPHALAKRVDKFCPNIIEKICDDLDELAEHFATRQQFHFWWD